MAVAAADAFASSLLDNKMHVACRSGVDGSTPDLSDVFGADLR